MGLILEKHLTLITRLVKLITNETKNKDLIHTLFIARPFFFFFFFFFFLKRLFFQYYCPIFMCKVTEKKILFASMFFGIYIYGGLLDQPTRTTWINILSLAKVDSI